jgi:hypothetical protein
LSPTNPRETLAREALRLHERYHRELIERLSVCPWAKPARAEDRTRAHVVTEASCSPEALRPILARWAANESVDVAFVIAPRFTADAEAFAAWAASIGEQESEVFLIASFHPSPPDPVGSIHFLRQTPDPTVQLVRRARLEEIRSQDPPHYTDIFDLDLNDIEAQNAPRTVAASVLAHNERMIEREGRPALQAIFDDIREDRERTYAKLLPLL